MPTRKGALLLFITGSVFLVFLAAWVIVDLTGHTQIDIATPLPIGNAFDGNDQVPIDEFKSKYQSGIGLIERHKAASYRYKEVHNVADWIAFLLTSSITLIVGLAGRMPGSERNAFVAAEDLLKHAEKPRVDRSRTTGKGRHLSRAVRSLGVLAALASISIAVSNRCEVNMRINVEAAVELNSILSKARVSWFNAKNPDEAVQTLAQLESDLIKRQ